MKNRKEQLLFSLVFALPPISTILFWMLFPSLLLWIKIPLQNAATFTIFNLRAFAQTQKLFGSISIHVLRAGPKFKVKIKNLRDQCQNFIRVCPPIAFCLLFLKKLLRYLYILSILLYRLLLCNKRLIIQPDRNSAFQSSSLHSNVVWMARRRMMPLSCNSCQCYILFRLQKLGLLITAVVRLDQHKYYDSN